MKTFEEACWATVFARTEDFSEEARARIVKESEADALRWGGIHDEVQNHPLCIAAAEAFLKACRSMRFCGWRSVMVS